MRITSASTLVPECHVEIWTISPLCSVGGERCLQLIARSRLPVSYDLQLYRGKGNATNSSMYQEAVFKKKRVSSACTRIRWGSEARSSSSQQVCNVLAVVLLEKAGRT